MKIKGLNAGGLLCICAIIGFLLLLGIGHIPAFAQEKLLVGICEDVSGFNADGGRAERDAILMGIEEWNKKGGIRGKKIEYIFRDNAGDPSKATTIAKEFIRNKVVAVFGMTSSTVGLAEVQALTPEKIPMMGGSASRKLWDYKANDGKSYYFSFCGSDPVHSEGGIAWYAEKGYKKLAIVSLNVAWPQDIQKNEMELIKEKYGPKYGMSVVGTIVADVKAKDLSKEVAAVKAMNPDAVITNMYGSNYVPWFRACTDLDYHPPTTGVWGLAETAYLSMDPRMLYNFTGYSYFSSTKKAIIEGFQKFKAKYNYSPVAHWSFGYQMTLTLFTAMEAVGFEGPKIRDYIASKMTGKPIILGHEKSGCFFQEGTPYFYSVIGPEDWGIVYINKDGEKVWMK